MKKKIVPVFVLLLVFAGFSRMLLRRGMNDGPVAQLFGNVDIREVQLAFRVPGRIRTLLVDEGSPVQRGQLLGELDLVRFEAEAAQFKAQAEGEEAL